MSSRAVRTESLMLVSAVGGPQRRRDVAAGVAPWPEFLALEARYGTRILDWTAIGRSAGSRSLPESGRHIRAALPLVRESDAVLSDGEHVGIPLALAMRASRVRTPHVMLGHHLRTPAKRRAFRLLQPERAIDRILVHSPGELDRISRDLGVAPEMLAAVPYGIDTHFWASATDDEDADLIVSVGREHRDYATLFAARPRGSKLAVAGNSVHARSDRQPGSPADWPADVERVPFQSATGLRDLYARAAVVVVAVVETTFAAGITTLLEAMSMGKAVVVTESAGLRGVVQHGETGVVVRPGNVYEMQRARRELLASRDQRSALGARAREYVVQHHRVESYADALATHLAEVSSQPRKVASR